jgi:thioredoxin reductase (NADPH)
MGEKYAKLLIIGSGPAGYTAAIYAARSNLSPLVVSGWDSGGQLMMTTDVENYPGFALPIQGPWLMDQMKAQAEHVGASLISDAITQVDFGSKPFRCTGESGTVYVSDSVIIATGAQARWLGLPSETHFRGFGVSACATCDGFFFRDKPVAVIGGGNSAIEEALFLTNHTSQVTLIHRGAQLRGEKILQDRLFKNPKIKVLWNTVVAEVLGEETPKMVTGLRLWNSEEHNSFLLNVEGVFVAIGHTPMTSVFADQVERDDEGYIKVKPQSTMTNVPGVFAAGDVQDKIYRQAITAAGQGCMAALEASKFLDHG